VMHVQVRGCGVARLWMLGGGVGLGNLNWVPFSGL
jgi:hypothetical protein